MLPNFALICPRVDAHLRMLSPISPAKRAIHIPRESFLCFLIRWMFIIANPTIHQINAVLESVSTMARIRSMLIDILRIVFLFACTNSLMLVNFCLSRTSIAGRNAIKKYP